MGDETTLRSKLRHQKSLQGLPQLAEKLLRRGRVRHLEESECLCREGELATSIYFILHGTFEISVRGRAVGRREPGQTIGELSAVDPSGPRSATVLARTSANVFEVDLDDLDQLTRRESGFYRNLAGEIAHRLRQRDRFIPTTNTVPHVIFLSSSESFAAIEALSKRVERGTQAICKTWKSPDVFLPGDYPLTSLVAQLDACDFAVALASGDDLRRRASTGEERVSPRDNILLEIGMFIGRLGAHRTLVLDPTSGEGSPSDLNGVTAIRYSPDESGSMPTDLEEVTNDIIKQIEWFGTDRSIREFNG